MTSMDDLPIIDADTHIVEPADLWTSRVDAPLQAIPHVRLDQSKGRYKWYIGDKSLAFAPAGATAGWKEPPPSTPPTFEDAHPGTIDVHERIKVMDDEGVWAQVLYPNVGGFGNGAFLSIPDVELRNECVRAYNDFLVEWTAPYRDRFAAIAAVPFWDVDASVAEIQRAHSIGHTGVLFTGKPDVWWGAPHLADPYWNPVWEVAQELDMPINFHAGGGDPDVDWLRHGYAGMPPRTRYTANSVAIFFGTAQTITDLIFAGIPERYPRLNFVSVETGIGWLPFLLECMDYQFMENGVRQSSPELRLLPSEYFRRQVHACFWFERTAPERLIDVVGEDNVMFETDFPHPTSLWPPESAKQQALTCMAGQSREVQEKVLWRNAARLYKIDVPARDAAARSAG
jgi:predicted TIM-barrel fold metal-dependent hydrolase